MLSDIEKTRYRRQFLLHGWGEKAQEKLKDTTVFVGGAGGSGSPILTQLALLGIGTIRICDYDTVELSNLNRQFIHCVSATKKIGINKAQSAACTINNINPHIKVKIFEERIDTTNVDEIVGDASILFDSVDHIPSKFILSACAVRKKIPHLFYGMMDINAFYTGFNPPNGPCFHCLYDLNKVKALQSLSAKINMMKKKETPVACPPLFVSTGFAVNEALKIILGHGPPVFDTYFLFLQKANSGIADSRGFAGMKFWITDHFNQISKDQGYDWEKGWCKNVIEQLKITSDPDCSICSTL
jgi:molybdopterin/thiamine biosynthesis adenylyltransferase